MAKCTSCGERTLDGRNICFYCEDAGSSSKNRNLSDESLVPEPSEDQLFSAVFSKLKKNLKAKLDKGISIYIHQTLEVSTPFSLDSKTYSSFDDNQVVLAGLQGWQIKGVVPKTHGIRLENVQHHDLVGRTNTWAGGVGGNVNGAFVLMSLELNDASQLGSSTFRDWCRKLFDDGFDFDKL